ncbi:MAG TPA: YihY/virulence factor BrkB family protein [Vicinamibacterales bacterium]|nr:YihY/virulence factor BrkB family protein [Vicinamibacterales bacterium]
MSTETRATPGRARALLGPVTARAWFEVGLSARALWRGFISFYNRDDLTFASSIAYYALFSLFPFFLLVFAILGSITADEGDRAAVLDFVFRYFPHQFEFVTGQLDALRRTTLQLGIAGSILMVWAVMGFFSAISGAVNYAWGVERQPSYFKHKLIALLMLTAASLLLLSALALISASSLVGASWFSNVLTRTPGLLVLRSYAVQWAPTALFILVVGLIFYFVPNANVRFRDVWVGAVLTGLFWRGALKALSWYMHDLSRFSVHGSIAAVVAFLLWIYVSAVIFLYGVEFTAAYARLRRHRPEDLPAAPTPRTEV